MPERLNPETLARLYPRLYHMAEEGSWPSIKMHGLLSTTALLDLFEVQPEERYPLETRRRPESVPIHHPVHGTAWIRDNKPINETVLRRTLEGMTEEQFYRTLNGRVFFWVSTDRLDRLATRRLTATAITTSSSSTPPRYSSAIMGALSYRTSTAVPCTLPPTTLGGEGTFVPIESYRYGERKQVSNEPVVEVTVLYAVPDVREFVVDMTTR